MKKNNALKCYFYVGMGSLILEGLKIFRRQPRSNLNFSFFDQAILIPTIYLVKSFTITTEAFVVNKGKA